MRLHSTRTFMSAIRQIRHGNTLDLAIAIDSGRYPRSRLSLLATQFYLQEKWPSHIAHVYLGLDEDALADLSLVRYVIGIMQAENLGVGSRGIPHVTLARHFASEVGVTERQLRIATPVPANQALMDWCDMSALERPWHNALAVHIACEDQADSMALIATGLRKHYGIPLKARRFWLTHGGPVERHHSAEGMRILARHAVRRNPQAVLYAFEMSCKFLRDFYRSLL